MQKRIEGTDLLERIRPTVNPGARQLQEFNRLVCLPIGLNEKVCRESVENLNQVLADSMTLSDLYRKHHWQVSGHTFYQMHLLFEKHYKEQRKLIDEIAERIQKLGGVSIAMAHDVAESTLIPRPPQGREEVEVQLERLLQAHEIILLESRSMARQAAKDGDDGTNDLLVSDVIRTNETQVWMVAEHLTDLHSESSRFNRNRTDGKSAPVAPEFAGAHP